MGNSEKAHRWRITQSARISGAIILFLWAGFWTFFSVAEMLGSEPGAWSHVIFPVLPIVVLFSLAITRPRIGAIALIAAGAFATVYIEHTMTRLTLAAPPVVIGALLLIGSRR